MRIAPFLSFSIGLILFGGVLFAQSRNSCRVIVHPDNPVSSLPRDTASKMFLKKTAQWDHGVAVLPVDLVPTHPAREACSQEIHGKSVSMIKNYWQQQIFSGRNAPPPEKASDADVLAHVRANPGAVGYVSGDTEPEGVKTLTLKD